MKKLILPFTLALAATGAAFQTGFAEDKPAAAEAKRPTYRVVDETRRGMPAELTQALKDAKVAPPPEDFKIPENAKVVLETTKGNITLQLDTKGAPLHARSFYYLAGKGFFDGTVFHRWADLLQGSGKPGNIIQGGDPLTKKAETRPWGGVGGPGYQIPRERNSSVHNALVLSAARTADPDSAGSQFYITQNPVKFLDEGDGYTVFGKVVDGKEAALALRQDDSITKALVQK